MNPLYVAHPRNAAPPFVRPKEVVCDSIYAEQLVRDLRVSVAPEAAATLYDGCYIPCIHIGEAVKYNGSGFGVFLSITNTA